LHFPVSAKITLVDLYGTENVGIVIDKFRRTFPVPREMLKYKALEILGPGTETSDAYMYEGKEGMKVIMSDGSRIEVLPGSVHFWCRVDDDKVKKYADWLMEKIYFNASD